MKSDQQESYDLVLAAMLESVSDPEVAKFHLENTKIRVLGDRTLAQAINAGEATKALRYLQTISSGQSG